VTCGIDAGQRREGAVAEQGNFTTYAATTDGIAIWQDLNLSAERSESTPPAFCNSTDLPEVADPAVEHVRERLEVHSEVTFGRESVG